MSATPGRLPRSIQCGTTQNWNGRLNLSKSSRRPSRFPPLPIIACRLQFQLLVAVRLSKVFVPSAVVALNEERKPCEESGGRLRTTKRKLTEMKLSLALCRPWSEVGIRNRRGKVGFGLSTERRVVLAGKCSSTVDGGSVAVFHEET